MDSPCVFICKIKDGVCIGCDRTLDEITSWRDMSMAERMAVMASIQERTTTHNCPECKLLTYCAMEAGKSASTCWCMTVLQKGNNISVSIAESCLCRTCLTK